MLCGLAHAVLLPACHAAQVHPASSLFILAAGQQQATSSSLTLTSMDIKTVCSLP